jgi:anti-sigma B factor antagonist
MPPRFTAAEHPPEPGIVFRLSYTLDLAGTGTPRVFLAGELSLTTADQARGVIQRAQEEFGDLLCDLTDVTFIDVSGVCVLLDLAARAQHGGGRFTVANPPAVVPHILRLFGLEQSLEAAPAWSGLATPTRANVCNAVVRPRAGRRTHARRRRLRP